MIKIVLPRWQKGMRERGAILECMVWATPRVLASKIFRFSSPLMQSRRFKSVYLLIHSEMGSSDLAFGQTAQECFNRHKHTAIVVSNSEITKCYDFDNFFSFLSIRQLNTKFF